MDTVVAELVSFLPALKSGSPIGYLILLTFVPICLALIVVALVYQRIVIERFQTVSKATQENFETIAADLRKRALGVKEHDEGLRKGEPELMEHHELKVSFKDADAELRSEPQRPQKQQQALKGLQRALKESVSHTITLGHMEIQKRLLQGDFKGGDVSSSSQLKSRPSTETR